MRRRMIAALVGAALGCAATLVPGTSVAGTAPPGIVSDAALLSTVQYRGERPYGGGWERRHARRARDEARMAAAARREAYRIRQERAHRRAWRPSQRDRYGYYRAY
jgi:hypothetical protein